MNYPSIFIRLLFSLGILSAAIANANTNVDSNISDTSDIKSTSTDTETETCTDLRGWSDSRGKPCSYYADAVSRRCQRSFAGQYSAGGTTALNACCACGGGSTKKKNSPDDSDNDDSRSDDSDPYDGKVFKLQSVRRDTAYINVYAEEPWVRLGSANSSGSTFRITKSARATATVTYNLVSTNRALPNRYIAVPQGGNVVSAKSNSRSPEVDFQINIKGQDSDGIKLVQFVNALSGLNIEVPYSGNVIKANKYDDSYTHFRLVKVQIGEEEQEEEEEERLMLRMEQQDEVETVEM